MAKSKSIIPKWSKSDMGQMNSTMIVGGLSVSHKSVRSKTEQGNRVIQVLS